MWSVLSPAASTGAVLLAAGITTLRLYDTPSINPDFYSGMFELAAGSIWLAALCTPLRSRRIVLALLAGLLWAAATSMKQTGCIGLLAVTIVALIGLAVMQDKRGRWALVAGLAWGGFAIGLGAVAAVLIYRGTLGAAWDAVYAFNQGLLAPAGLLEAVTSFSRQRAGLEPIQLGLFLAFIGAVITLWSGQANNLTRAAIIALMVWWVAQVEFALLGPSRSMRYWQATFPAMLWLAGAGAFHVEELFGDVRRSRRAALAIISIALLFFLARPLVAGYKHGLATSYLTYGAEDTQRTRLMEIGRRVANLVPESERVYVWAYDAGIYLYASRRPACRYTYPRSEPQMREILDDLAAGKAYAIIKSDGQVPYFDQFCDGACQETFRMIQLEYKVVDTVGHYNVLVRR
jgi:hypothetical protein